MIKSKKFVKKTKKGRVLTVNREHYLRDDISCGFTDCKQCNLANSVLRAETTLFPDTNVILHQLDVLEHPTIANLIITSTVLNEVKHRSLSAYSRLRAMISDKDKRFYVYSNEHSKVTAVDLQKGESPNDYNDRAIRVCAKWYAGHIAESIGNEDCQVVLLTNDADNLAKAKTAGIIGYTVHEYVRRFIRDPSIQDLLAYPADAHANRVMTETDTLPEPYQPYIPEKKLQEGIKGGLYVQGSFVASRENSREGFVRRRGGEEGSILVQDLGMNRAVNGDIVAVELLPKDQWSTPMNVAEKLETKVLMAGGKEDADDVAEEGLDHTVPTGRVVGVIRRRWRQYCGVLVSGAEMGKPPKETDECLLFSPQDNRIPPIRFRSMQAANLLGKQIIVAIDAWPAASRYPTGHLVRVLGDIGDVNTETEVILLEHGVPYETFSHAVLACLPKDDWTIHDDPASMEKRTDFRHLDVCSIDPPGCTDIDDALHIRILDNGNYEVGVHIADVTHFIRPNTAIDKEAASRGTTVYLSNRRIDMVPGLLSSNLCSLRGGEERFAFSCLWELTPKAKIVQTSFTKSIIRSRVAMTYGQAQARIDDASDDTSLTQGLRILNGLAKELKRGRLESGALLLASTEVRFSMDSETHDPVEMQVKEQMDTNSLVEEFMLLANVSTAEHIFKNFPQCAVLRRHPAPPPANFEPLLKAAAVAGVELSTASSKDLAISLDNAEPEGKAYLKTLLRMLATRSMMQAVYFSSGAVAQEDFKHYGLAAPIYTHFTSPIRRYADVLVHRLLAASIHADATYPELLDKTHQSSVCDRLNQRNRMAQYASRSSIQLHSCIFFKDRPTCAVGYVVRVLKNAVKILIPHFGIEGPVYFDPAREEDGSLDVAFDEVALRVDVSSSADSSQISLHIFDEVKVRVAVDEADAQRKRIVLHLVEPQLTNFTVDAATCTNYEADKLIGDKLAQRTDKKADDETNEEGAKKGRKEGKGRKKMKDKDDTSFRNSDGQNSSEQAAVREDVTKKIDTSEETQTTVGGKGKRSSSDGEESGTEADGNLKRAKKAGSKKKKKQKRKKKPVGGTENKE